MNTDSPQFVTRSAFRFFSGTMISKISGMIRDMTMAFFLGTSSSLAAFLVAFRFVYLARRLFGESLLHQGFIPHFEEKKHRDPKEGALFFRDLFWTIAFVLAILMAIALFILSRFSGECAFLSSLMLPGIFFICLFGFCTGLLQAEKSFFIPSVSPVVSNIVWISSLFFLKDLSPPDAMKGLALILTGAFFLQWAMTFPKMFSFLKRNLSVKEMLIPSLFSQEIRILARPLLFAIIGVASVQINTAMDGIFARFAAAEGPAYLWYAIRMQQLPLALFGIAFSSALLPSLSRAHERGNRKEFFELLCFTRRRIFAFTAPCVVAIFSLGLSSINLLFGRGDFGPLAITQTTLCLWAYGLGLVPMALVQIYATPFYAKKDYRTPMIGFVLSAGLNFLLNFLFVFIFEMGAVSIALATSIASAINCFYLINRLKGLKEIWSSSWVVALCSILAGAVVLVIGRLIGDSTLLLLSKNAAFPSTLSLQMKHFFLQAGLYFGLFFWFCKLFRAQDILEIIRKLISPSGKSFSP